MFEDINFKEVHYYSCYISSIFGIFVNLFTIYLVKTQTSRGLRYYSVCLVQNCTVDLVCNVIILITKVQIVVSDGYMIWILEGYLENVSYPYNILFYMMFASFLTYSIVAMTIPFYIRYRVFCKYVLGLPQQKSIQSIRSPP